MQQHSLLEKIEKKRKQMCDHADKYGLSDADTVRHSQELDQLITLYQREMEQNQGGDDS